MFNSNLPSAPIPVIRRNDGIANSAAAEALDVDGNPATVDKAESDASGTTTRGNFEGRDPDLLAIGEQIKVDESGKIHEVKAGDTLSSIAQANDADLNTLMKINGFDQSLLGQRSDGLYYDQNAAAKLVPPTGLEINRPITNEATTSDAEQEEETDAAALDTTAPDVTTTDENKRRKGNE